MERYIAAGIKVESDAKAAGLDPGKAQTAWSACMRHVGENPATFAPVVGESHAGKRRRMQAARKRRAELTQVAGFALGATILTLLFNWALGKLLSWIVDRVISDMDNTPVESWQEMFPPKRVYGLMYVPLPPTNWWMRLCWWIVDYVSAKYK